MIQFDSPQGSPTWLAERAGYVTASEADNIVTPVQLKPSAGKDYFRRIVAERLLGQPVEQVSSAFMERGQEYEPRAAAWYANERDVDPQTCGFLLRDAEDLGASPDRLVGEDGVLEIKVPGAKAHVGYLMDPASFRAEYRGQSQVELLVTGRAWCDLLSYNPRLPKVIERIEPDHAYVRAFEDALGKFLERVKEAVDRFGGAVKPRRRAASRVIGEDWREPVES